MPLLSAVGAVPPPGLCKQERDKSAEELKEEIEREEAESLDYVKARHPARDCAPAVRIASHSQLPPFRSGLASS